jgi:hypothetical protein
MPCPPNPALGEVFGQMNVSIREAEIRPSWLAQLRIREPEQTGFAVPTNVSLFRFPCELYGCSEDHQATLPHTFTRP